MKFKAEQVRRITFPTASLSGYKKQDVDDFLKHVADDYTIMESEENLLDSKIQLVEIQKKELAQEFEEKEKRYLEELAGKDKEISQMSAKLKEIGEDENEINSKKRSFEDTLIIAQDVAFKIEQKAKVEAKQIVTDALIEKDRIVKDANIEVVRVKEEAFNLLAEANANLNDADRQYKKQMKELELEKSKAVEDTAKEIEYLEQKKQMMLKEIEGLETDAKNVRFQIISEYQRAINNLSDEKWQRWMSSVKNSIDNVGE
ncbi:MULTISPECIES: DivIVA domain-containing protein [unclassified Enterococcus]|uniref:DivIVA domain-containing protein n=1 Tax=unclassified Enterococcus TaxID=2608891 RepID=UPI001A9A6EAE|nr:DivIVA domain-containing protein [Enterococcus sp. DIV1271a]MBO1299608.1 DivIVA domain-containing protein [Enterococcus sp. DIV1271a]